MESMKRIRACVIAALAGAAVVGAMCYPSVASALSKRVHGSVCHVIGGSSGLGNDGIFGIYAASNNTQLACPIDEDPDFARNTITGLQIYGYQDNGTLSDPLFTTKACRSYSTSDGGTCGPGNPETTQGNLVSSPNISAWSVNTGFAYVFVGQMQINDDVRGIYFFQ